MNCFLPFLVISYLLSPIEGADPFEAFIYRLECFGAEQPGCTTDYFDAYPNLRYSYGNTTRATTFLYLFTRDNKETPELLHKCPDLTPPGTNFNPEVRTEFIIPGYMCGPCNMAIFREIKNELLKRDGRNVILVDSMWGSFFDTIASAKNLKVVADQVAQSIKTLKKKYGLTHEDIICTGHSYGAHVCALIGQREHISIINGLDPSGVVMTENMPLDERLDSSDADCVQVIHTNALQCLPFSGCNFTCGTVDIWPNGGLYQQSCSQQTPIALAKLDYIYGLFNILACSHLQALQYYKASINAEAKPFVAVKCHSYERFKNGRCSKCGRNGRNCIVMGADCCDCLNGASWTEQGPIRIFFLDTDDSCPYINNTKINLNGFRCSYQRK